MSEQEKFEAHIKETAWYRVLSDAAKDDDDGASVFRMARMAASEAWIAARATPADHISQARDAVIEQCAKACESQGRKSITIDGNSFYIGVGQAAAAIRAMTTPRK